MRKVRKFSIRKFLLFLVLLIIVLLLILIGIYKYEIGPVSAQSTPKDITIEKGANYFSISKTLKEKNLIKSETFYKLYLKLNKPETLLNGVYRLNENMSVKDIVSALSDKENSKAALIKLTFREGLNVRQMAKIVEKETGIKEDEFINQINNKEYLNTLKNKYWFITDSIFNNEIYYPLEGYLFPDTYHFSKDELNSKAIIEKILDNTEKKLEPYKEKIQNSNMNIHQILTLASLIELEAESTSDRNMVSGVFYNRLKNGWSLGSDVTTYYAAKKDMQSNLTKTDLNDCNGYNTRCTKMTGLPVGPIDNPSLSSLEAALNPEENDYYYFVADTSKKVYFSKTANEHNQIIKTLKEQGKWAA